MLGALTKNLKSISLLGPNGPVAPPYIGISFDMLSERLCDLDFPTLRLAAGRHYGYHHRSYSGGSCCNCNGIKPTVDETMTRLKEKLCGLEIADILPKKRKGAEE